jgi:carbonic anhydrase/acetyltransferase-like protein (isoleucine patch superfamily)
MSVYRLGDARPELADDCWVAPGAHVMAQVRMGAGASVWFGAILRGDNEPIELGARSNVQEGAVLHTDPGFPMNIGADCTIGHQAMLHGCRIGAGTLIGIQAIVLNGAVIGEQSLVAAGALVTEGKQFPPRSLILGTPAKAVRTLSEDEVKGLHDMAQRYAARAQRYRHELVKLAGASD